MQLATIIAGIIAKLIEAIADAVGSPVDELRADVLKALAKEGDPTDAVADEIEDNLP